MLAHRCLKYSQEITETFPCPPLNFKSSQKSFQSRIKEKFYAPTTPCIHRQDVAPASSAFYEHRGGKTELQQEKFSRPLLQSDPRGNTQSSILPNFPGQPNLFPWLHRFSVSLSLPTLFLPLLDGFEPVTMNDLLL